MHIVLRLRVHCRAVFDDLSERLRSVLGRLSGRGRVTEADVDAAMREVRLALLEADVNFRVVKDFIARVRERAVGVEVLGSLNAGQQVIKIVHEELTATLGAGDRAFHMSGSPAVVMLLGLQGSGKTTSAAKLARHITRQGRRPMLVAADPYRPAAADQLETLGRQIDIPVHRARAGTGTLDICRGAIAAARQAARDVVIIDTAGRTSIDQPLMDEIRQLSAILEASETLLVVDAMAGQESVSVAQAFAEAAPVTGLVLTKIDGDARGGAALSISAVTGLPVKFLGTGERTDALEPFHPDRLAGRILGMGDMLTLIEKAKSEITEEEVESLTVRMKKGELTLDDFLAQYQRIKRMGPIGNLLGMLPGLSQIKKQLNVDEMDEDFFKHTEAIIMSMTKAERANPDLIDGSRRRRIAAGSGMQPADVNRVIKQFREAKKIMQMISTGRGSKITTPSLR